MLRSLVRKLFSLFGRGFRTLLQGNAGVSVIVLSLGALALALGCCALRSSPLGYVMLPERIQEGKRALAQASGAFSAQEPTGD